MEGAYNTYLPREKRAARTLTIEKQQKTTNQTIPAKESVKNEINSEKIAEKKFSGEFDPGSG